MPYTFLSDAWLDEVTSSPPRPAGAAMPDAVTLNLVVTGGPRATAAARRGRHLRRRV